MKIFSFFRKQKIAVRSFAAALINRLTSDWISSFMSQDAEIKNSIKVIRNRARDLGRNDDYVRAYLRSVENNIVGRGIKLQSNIRDDMGNPLVNINNQIEKEWVKWCRMDSCHAGGTLSFQDIERLLIRNRHESGEILVQFIYENLGQSKVRLALKIIEADLLDENFNGVYGDNIVRMGIEQDKNGRPVAFHLLAQHPGDTVFPQQNLDQKRIRVPAKDIIHLFKSERPIQSRGISSLSSAMLSLRHLSGFVEATIVRKRSEASVMGFIQSPEGELSGVDVNGRERIEDFSPGKFHYLAPGETVQVPQISAGQSDFDAFSNAMIRKIATGIGSSYEELSKDYSRSNYSSSRLALISERDHWKSEQDWFIRNFHQKVFEKFLEVAVYQGVVQIKIDDFLKYPEKFCSPKWMPRGWDWVDPMKDALADKESLKAGIKTYSEILADEGKDFEETMQQIKKERDFMKKLGIVTDIEVVPQMKNNNLNGVDDNEDPEKS